MADWERTIRAGGLRALPRKPCVADILKVYVAKAKAGKVGDPCNILRVTRPLFLYFADIFKASVARAKAGKRPRQH